MSWALLLLPLIVHSEPHEPIKRDVLGVTLGTPESEFLRERSADVIGEGPGADDRTYLLRDCDDPDVRRATVEVLGSRVLKVDVEFSDRFIRTNDWFDLVRRFASRYGESSVTQLAGPDHVTDMIDWRDGRTMVVLRHRCEPLPGGIVRYAYLASYMDADYYVESLRRETPMARLPAAIPDAAFAAPYPR